MSRLPLARPDSLEATLRRSHDEAAGPGWAALAAARAHLRQDELLEPLLTAGQYSGFGRALAVLRLTQEDDAR